MHMWRENCMTIFKIFKRDFPKVLKNAHSCLLLSGTQLYFKTDDKSTSDNLFRPQRF